MEEEGVEEEEERVESPEPENMDMLATGERRRGDGEIIVKDGYLECVVPSLRKAALFVYMASLFVYMAQPYHGLHHPLYFFDDIFVWCIERSVVNCSIVLNYVPRGY